MPRQKPIASIKVDPEDLIPSPPCLIDLGLSTKPLPKQHCDICDSDADVDECKDHVLRCKKCRLAIYLRTRRKWA